jgi:hypothetical protein
VEGDLLEPGPAAAWFRLDRPVVDLRAWSFVNADLTLVLWREPQPPWILLRADTQVGDRGTGVARGELWDLDGAFGICAQTLLFERRAPRR